MKPKHEGKKVVVGVTGSIASIIVPYYIKHIQQHLTSDVQVMMTPCAQAFVTPMTFEVYCNKPVIHNFWKSSYGLQVPHNQLGKSADLFIVLPATVNFIGKLASGVADNVLLAAMMASRSPAVIFPTMNEVAWSHPFLQRNLNTLREAGYIIPEPDVIENYFYPDSKSYTVHEVNHFMQTIDEILSNHHNPYSKQVGDIAESFPPQAIEGMLAGMPVTGGLPESPPFGVDQR